MTIMVALMLFLQASLPFSALSYTGGEQTLGLMGDDFIISFPNGQNASSPTIAMTPTNEHTLKEPRTAGSVHVVWDEYNEISKHREIHYSMSQDGGYTWSGEREDIVISNITEKANQGDAVQPSIAVDSLGWIHVIWAEQYPGGLWEIHYSRSENNGKSWTSSVEGDKRISSLGPDFDAHIISAPKLTAGIIQNQVGPNVLHVVWSEHDMERNRKEVFYSRSDDGGRTWSGEFENTIISSSKHDPGTGFASDPAVSVSGKDAQFVHVSWSQKGVANTFDEVYYLRSDDQGKSWRPEDERPISLDDPEDRMTASNVSMTTFGSDVHLVWSQKESGKSDQGGHIIYLGSPDDGNTWTNAKQEKEIPINNNLDGNVPFNPTVAVTNMGAAYVFWCEIHDKSIEVHTSYNEKPMHEPEFWTGQKDDIIISNPGGEQIENASSVSVTIGALPNGTWVPQVVWEEPKTYEYKESLSSTGGNTICAAPSTKEIHYNPPPAGPPSKWTLTLTSDGSGSTSKDPDKTEYDDGETVSVQAYPSTGWSFSYWYGDAFSYDNPLSISIYSNMSVVAYFTQNQYTLSLNTYGSGSVSKSPDQATYTYGTTVQLTAAPEPGWRFDQWTGSASGTSNTTSVVMNANKVVNAYFAQNIYNISLSVGWNMVSLPFEQTNTSIASVLSSIDGKYDSVKYYDTLDAADHWKTYRPGSSRNDLAHLNHTMAFWVNVTASCTLSVYGNMPASTDIMLYTGWNFVGYPSATARLASNTLPSQVANIISVFQATSPYVSDSMDLSSVTMARGNGYWVHMTEDATWTVDY